MATTAGEAKAKNGIWTEHVDAASGRKYYFNMVHNRSYWELPEDLLAQVHRPVIETLREWDPDAAAKYDQPSSEKGTEEEELQRKKREELLQAAAQAAEANSASNIGAVQERMALAAAQKRAEEMKRLAAQQKAKEEENAAAAGNDYITMVRELQANDRDTESTGGKWLVR